MNIACIGGGPAQALTGRGLRVAFRLADERMYENKRATQPRTRTTRDMPIV